MVSDGVLIAQILRRALKHQLTSSFGFRVSGWMPVDLQVGRKPGIGWYRPRRYRRYRMIMDGFNMLAVSLAPDYSIWVCAKIA